MYGILLSALRAMAAWSWRPLLVKFAVMFGAWFLVTEGIDYLLAGCGFNGTCEFGISSIDALVGYLNSSSVLGMRYFLNMMAFPFALKVILAASATRFFIRRLPVIG